MPMKSDQGRDSKYLRTTTLTGAHFSTAHFPQVVSEVRSISCLRAFQIVFLELLISEIPRKLIERRRQLNIKDIE